MQQMLDDTAVTLVEESVSTFARRDHRYLRCDLVASATNLPAHLTTGVEAVRRILEDATKKFLSRR